MKDETAAGGPNESFETTVWTDLLNVRTDDEGRRNALLDQLIRRYWKPIYCYLRRKGKTNEQAKDLTQGFFCDVVLGRGLAEQADQSRGRFRTFLLTALDRYVTSAHRAETAQKRRPPSGLIYIDDAESVEWPAAGTATPEQAFNHAWASEVLSRVLAAVENECTATGKHAHWQVFFARVVRPIMEGIKPPTLSQVCAECGLPDESKASNMIVTVKRRFKAALRCEVRLMVSSGDDVDAEIKDLIDILAGPGAG